MSSNERDDARDVGEVEGTPRPGVCVGTAKRHGLLSALGVRWQRDRNLSWAVAANASSRFPRHNPVEVIGPPDVYPLLRDADATWAPLRPDGGVEWLDVEFAPSDGVAHRVLVFETCGPGAVFAVTELVDTEDYRRKGRRWRPLWQGLPDRGPHREAQLLVVELEPARKVARLRLWLDTRIDRSWNMIDAVALRLEQPAHRSSVRWGRVAPVLRAVLADGARWLDGWFE